MSISIVTECVVNRLTDGVTYNNKIVPVIDQALTQAENQKVPDLHIIYPMVTASIINVKGAGFSYDGVCSIGVYADTVSYGEGVPHQVIDLIIQRLSGWTPTDQITLFQPMEIDSLPSTADFRFASVSYKWRA